MPWSTRKDVARHNHAAAKSKRKTRIWLKVANEHLKKTGDEGAAIRIANAVMKNLESAVEAAAKPPVSRVDNKVKNKKIPKDFSKNQQTYVHSPDWNKSGKAEVKPQVPFNWKLDKGTFGSNPKTTAPYAVPKGVRWMQVVDSSNQSHIFFDKKDEGRIRKNKATQSTWTNGKQSRFKPLKNTMQEEFSKNPGIPTKQKAIQDPIKFMEANGHTVHFVNDLDSTGAFLLNNRHKVKFEGNFDDLLNFGKKK